MNVNMTTSWVTRKQLLILLSTVAIATLIFGLFRETEYIKNVIHIDTNGILRSYGDGSSGYKLKKSFQRIGNVIVEKVYNSFGDSAFVTTARSGLTGVVSTTAKSIEVSVTKTIPGRLKIALLIPSTSRSIPKEEFFKQSSLVKLTLPALHQTMEVSKYDYFIYLGIDKGDYMETIQAELKNLTKHLIPVVVDSTNFVENANAIAKRAFDDGMDYFVRLNDDTRFVTPGWTTIGIDKLRSYKPPNLGVVGPTCNQGNTAILTHDMVHRTHMEIFSHYYPVEFSNWWSDDWITMVYQPHWSTKVPNWVVVHPMVHGTRYKVDHALRNRMKLIGLRDKPKVMGFAFPKRQVVSFSLFGNDSKYTDGALANAELMKTTYPDWVMRIYHDKTVPKPILTKLKAHEHVHLVEMSKDARNKAMWRFLVASDQEVNIFVIRDIDARVSAREKSAVDKWLETDAKFHVMRDHPEQTKHAMTGGLWGGRKGAIPNIGQLMAENVFDSNTDESAYFMDHIVWPIVKQSVVQHDSFSCKFYGPSVPFPTPRKEQEFVGSHYVNGAVDKTYLDALINTKECT